MYTFNYTKKNLNLIKKYKIIEENIDECIWLFDLASKKFKYISPSIFKLRGLTVEAAMKQKHEDRFTPESLQKMKSQLSRRLSKFVTGDISKSVVCNIDEYDQYCKNGTTKKIEISTKLIFNKETNIIYILGVSRKVCCKKKIIQ